jgi:hypothetical protein
MYKRTTITINNIIMLCILCGCSNPSRELEGVMQIAGEQALGYYHQNKRLPDSDYLKDVLKSDSNIVMEKDDRFRVTLIPGDGSVANQKIELILITSNGSEYKRTFRVESQQ